MHNRRVLADALFDAAHEALSELLDDPRYLGARPGVLLALHTWGRNLALHPHIHALVSDGGFDGESWCPARRRHFLPARVLMALFRGKFLARLQVGIDAGEIVLPAALSPDDARRLLGRCARKRWNVNLRTGYAHGEGVVRYLARYVRGGAIQSSQIVAVHAQQITLRYHAHDTDGEEAGGCLLHLTPDGFLQRTLQHVPPARAHQVRRYGLYAGRAGEARERARRALIGRAVPAAETPTPADAAPPLATPTAAHPATRDWRRYLAGVPAAASCTCCATCAHPIVWLRAIPPQRPPPRPPPGRPEPIV